MSDAAPVAPPVPPPAAAATSDAATSDASTVPSSAPESGMSTPSVLTHRAVRAVAAALEAGGVSPSVIRVMPDTAPTAAAAAAQLGCTVAAIANSLMFEVAVDGKPAPLLILTSGGHRVDTKQLGPRLGLSKSAIKRAKPDNVKAWTGQAIGGVAPVGHLAPVRTLVDEELKQFDVVWAAAGHHQAVFPVDFDTLVRMTNGEVVKVD